MPNTVLIAVHEEIKETAPALKKTHALMEKQGWAMKAGSMDALGGGMRG